MLALGVGRNTVFRKDHVVVTHEGVPSGRLDAHVRCDSRDDQGSDIVPFEPRFKVGRVKRTVAVLWEHCFLRPGAQKVA